jgi:hypothetical protein
MAAVSSDGDVWPCVMSRWMSAGNVRQQRLAEILAGATWGKLVSSIGAPHGSKNPCAPDKTGCRPKGDGGDCQPAEKPACRPKFGR